MLTLIDIIERLRTMDEVSLLEVLGISSEDLIERFEDRIEEQADALEKELDDTDEGFDE
jgi:hypothetical protein